MTDGSARPSEFWKQLHDAQAMARSGEREAAAARLQAALDALPEGMGRNLAALIGRGLELETGLPERLAAVPATLAAGGDLPPLGAVGRPGISLVTCAMNRTGNLIRALRSWRLCPELSEIVIVDWSSAEPVRPALREAGLLEERVRVVRVEGEPRWILSHAFNAGFRAAACDRILKADADIVLEPDFFRRNRLKADRFVAGNWRRAGEGQAYVNGFFYAHRADLAAIGGFNEYITTYGWDDDDLYHRLEEHGAVRQDVDPGSVHHLPHSDEERLGAPQGAPGRRSLRQEITAGTQWYIRRNRFIANAMPHWDDRLQPVPFEIREMEPGRIQIRRRNWTPNPVPAHVKADADYYALMDVASWTLGRRVFALDRARLDAVLERPTGTVGKLEIEAALAMEPEAFRAAGPLLVIALGRDVEPRDGAAALAFERLAELARAQGRTPVVTGPYRDYPERFCAAARACPLIPDWQEIGAVTMITPRDLASARAPRTRLRVVFDAAAVEAPAPRPAAPAVGPARPRLFIDAQHGLGNRLRAIGSAAAAAEASGRELVVVWQPDHHCEARLSDLFDYDGSVIEESFTGTAARIARLYNYMEVEPGAQKDAPIDTNAPGDIYARSAYTLRAPGSDWEAANRFLQALTPAEAVRDLVASVRSPNDLSAHVRMVGAPGSDTASYDRAENWTPEGHALINHWREKSHYAHFMRRIDALIAEGTCDTLFLAADAPETYAEFLARYGDRIAHLPRTLYDRSAQQLHYALADAILLARAPRLLGSTWSSFSELAARLARQEMTVEMSGTDF